MHRNTKLTSFTRTLIFRLWSDGEKVSSLAAKFLVTRPIIYKILRRAKVGDFTVHGSGNRRFQNIQFGLKRLAKAEEKTLEMVKRRVHRYEKSFPGEMVHIDSKALRRAKQDDRSQVSEYLYVAIDDRSRELFAEIMRGKNQKVSAAFLEKIIQSTRYKIECMYSDNGKEFKGGEQHEFSLTCKRNGIEQKYTRVGRPQTNGKAERVIRTIMETCDLNNQKRTSEERKKLLKDFVEYYNARRPHSALKEGKDLLTPCQILQKYSFSKSVYNA